MPKRTREATTGGAAAETRKGRENCTPSPQGDERGRARTAGGGRCRDRPDAQASARCTPADAREKPQWGFERLRRRGGQTADARNAGRSAFAEVPLKRSRRENVTEALALAYRNCRTRRTVYFFVLSISAAASKRGRECTPSGCRADARRV